MPGLKGPLQIPNLKGIVHPQAEQAIRLLYQSQNDLASALGAASAASPPATLTTPTSPATLTSPSGLNGSYSSPPAGLSTAIASVPLLLAPATGLWALSYYLYTITAATAGTVTLTLSWHDEAASRTLNSAACDLTSLAMVQGRDTLRVAGTGVPTPVEFSTAFSGLTGTPVYALFIRLEPLD